MADIKDNKPYIISIGTDNRPGGVEGEFHLQFKPDIMRVTFGEQEKVAKEFGGTMRVTNGQEWADFYYEADAVKFAEKVVGMNQERELQARFDAFKAKHGEEPLYAEVTIRWKDDGTEQEDIIKLSDDIDERDDDKVFFNVTGLNDLKGLINPDNGEDFYIVDVQGITFQSKSQYLNDEKAMTIEQVQEKAVKLFGNKFEFDYWNETEAGTKIDRIDLGGMPDTISIDKLEIKDGQLSLYSNDIASDIDLQALDSVDIKKVDASLDDIKDYNDKQQTKLSEAKSVLAPFTEDQWKVMSEIGYPYAPGNAKEHEAAPIPEMIYWRLAAGFITHEDAVRAFSTTGYTVCENPQRTREILSELNSQHGKLDADLNPLTNQSQIEDKKLTDAKAKLFATILEAQKDLGKELSISPTTVVYYKQKDIVCKIIVEVDYENDELLIGGVNEAGNDISAYNMGGVLDNTDNVNVLKKAIHEAHINHLEQNAKLSIRDRIITPSARRFTPDQVEALNRYHQVAVPDKPAGEVFKELLHEVAQEPEVARKPEKWVTDTLKELNGIAEGITREETRGLHL